jgi:hypothetical protein
MPKLAAELRSLRRYVNPPSSMSSRAVLDDGLTSYLGGFFTGEGHLALSASRGRVAIRLRADDRQLLEDLAAATGLGRLYSAPRRGRTAPSVSWIIYRRSELATAARLLSAAGLRGRKWREFVAWRPAAVELASAEAERRRPRANVIATSHRALAQARMYRPGPAFATTSQREWQRQRCVCALSSASAARPGPLTVTAYSAWRSANPQWPNRDTITRAFGSWSEALAAAGLRGRCASRGGRTRREPDEFTLFSYANAVATADGS